MSALFVVITKTMTFVDSAWSCFPQRSQHLLICSTMGSLMSCHLRAQSQCPGHGPCESHKLFNLGYLRRLCPLTCKNTFWRYRLVLHFITTHSSVCLASEPLWIPCPPSIVDPFLHKASPAPTLQTVRRIMWLWWVPIAGGEIGKAHCVLCFNDPLVCMLRLLSAACVSESSPLSPLAESSVYLPSRKWYQQPGPQEKWQRGLPCTGLSAWVTQPTQKSKHFVFQTNLWNCFFFMSTTAPFILTSTFLSFHSLRHPLWPQMRRWTMCKLIRRRPRHCKAPCRSGPMCDSLLSLPKGSSPDTDLEKTLK